MARGINDIQNGLGFVYITDRVGTNPPLFYYNNDEQGVRDCRHNLAGNAPIAAARIAYGILEILTVASVGQITDVTISGINQIAAPLNVATNNATVQAGIVALAINSFTPLTGLNYTAQAFGKKVYIYEPLAAAGTSNGLAITMGVTDVSITYAATPFANGAVSADAFDPNYGRRAWLDANYGPNGIPGDQQASRTDIQYAIEVTEFLTVRGTETGHPSHTVVIATDALPNAVTRLANIIRLLVDTEGAAATDNLESINTANLFEGDIVIVKGVSNFRVTTVISQPNASIAATPNIYLTGDNSFATTKNAVLMLEYIFDPLLGPILREIARSTPQTSLSILRNLSLWNDPAYGDDATAAREDFIKINQTLDNAIILMQPGDTLNLYPGTHAIVTQQLLAKAGVTIISHAGALVTGTNYLNAMGAGSRIVGSGDFVHTDEMGSYPGNDVSIECNNLTIRSIIITTSKGFNLLVKQRLEVYWYILIAGDNEQCYLRWNKAFFTQNLAGIYCVGVGGTTAPNTAYAKGDIYLMANRDSIINGTGQGTQNSSPAWEGKIFVDPVTCTSLLYIIRCYENQNGSIISPNRFITKGEIYCPVEVGVSAINALGGGELEFIGKMFLENQSAKHAVISDTDAATRNLPSKVFLTDCDIYTDTIGSVCQIIDLGFTAGRSRIIGKNTGIIAPNASAWINGDVAGCLYQCKGIWANKPTGANAANELAGQDVQVDVLTQ